jgi:flagellar basal body rod protein FlgG
MIRVQRTYESVTSWMKNADDLRRTAIERLSGVQA